MTADEEKEKTFVTECQKNY